MNKFFLKIFLLSVWAWSIALLSAQTPENDCVDCDSVKYNATSMHLTVQKGFLLGSGQDSVPINPSGSGSFFTGLVCDIELGRKWALKIKPGLNWMRVSYRNGDSTKTFPTAYNTLTENERHLISYVEVPVGVAYVVNRDEDGHRKFYVEGGLFAGVPIGRAYRYKVQDDEYNQQVKIKGLKDIAGLRYGAYGQLGYKFLYFFVSGRLSKVFKKEVKDPYINQNISLYPLLPGFEAGVGITL